MKMDDQALEHLMETQTQMLQQMRTMQQDQKDFSSEVTQQNLQRQSLSPEAVYGPAPPSVASPTAYGTYAAPYAGGGRQSAANDSWIGEKVNQISNYDATNMSPEETARFFSEQSQGIQEKAVDTIGGAAGGVAAAGSFLIPGILPALAAGTAVGAGVGMATDSFAGEAKLAMDYQKSLQDQSYKVINPSESTGDMGEVGFGLEERQDISKYLRHLAPEKLVDDDEMQEMLQGATNNNLMRTVSDVESFKEKFSDVVDAVKTITVTMNQTIEEATQFMGEMERRGVSTQDMPSASAQAKTMSSYIGVSPTEGGQMLLQATDSITQGTSVDASEAMQGAAGSIYTTQMLQERSREEGDPLYNYIKNQGGAALGAQFEQRIGSLATSERGKETLTGLMAPAFEMNDEGTFELNEQRMQSILHSDTDPRELQQSSQQYLSTLTNSEQQQLYQQSGSLVNQMDDRTDIAALAQKMVENLQDEASKSGTDITDEQALMEIGMSRNYDEARYMNEMLEERTDPGNKRQFAAMSLQQEQQAADISTSPGFFQEMKYGYDRTVGNWLGDQGQNVSDALGTTFQGYQKFVTGIETNQMVNDPDLADFTDEGFTETFGEWDDFIENQQTITDFYGREEERYTDDPDGKSLMRSLHGESASKRMKAEAERAQDMADDVSPIIDDEGGFGESEYDYLATQLSEGTMTASQLADLSDREDEMGTVEHERFQRLQNKASGKYDGFWGGTLGMFNKLGLETMELFESDPDGADIGMSLGGNTMGDLENQMEDIGEAIGDSDQELNKLFSSGALSDMSREKRNELEKSIRSGDVSDVQGLTDNKDVIDLAKDYQGHRETESALGENVSKVSDVNQYATAVASMPSQISKMIATTGVMDESSLDVLMGDLNEAGEELQEKMKDDDISISQMGTQSKRLMERTSERFASLSSDQLSEVAAGLSDKMGSNVENLFVEGTKEVDPEKLSRFALGIAQTQHSAGEDDEDNEDGESEFEEASGKVSKALKEHTNSMYEYLQSINSEREMLEDASEGGPIKYSSNTNR